jgi:N-acetylmuramoyl-L-alanine amidase
MVATMLLCPISGIAAGQFVVVIDAGHGGGDPGTLHRKFKQDEKTIALNVALKLGKLIEQNHPDVKIVYTRTTDVYPTLPDRTRIAREAKGNLFISIHVNSAQSSSAKGVETYVFGITGLQGKSAAEQKRIRERTMIERENLDIDGKQIDFETAVDIETKILCQAQREKHNKYSQEVAHYVQNNIMSALRKSDYRSNAVDRGVKQKNIFVLCYSPMPAILVELGYMTNYNEEKFLNTANAQTLFAQAIFRGFEQYKSNWSKRQLREEIEVPVVADAPAIADAMRPEPAAETSAATTTPSNTVTPAPSNTTATPSDIATPAPQPEPQPNPATEPSNATPTPPAPKIDVAYTANAPAGTEVPMLEKRSCYRIQFMSSTTRFKRGDAALKGLWPVQCYEVNGYFRYTYGEAADRSDLQQAILKVRKSFPDAFSVHFDENGNRIR